MRKYHEPLLCVSVYSVTDEWHDETEQRSLIIKKVVKVKVIPQQAEVAQGVPDRLRPRIFLTFGTTRVVGRQQYVLAAFNPGEILTFRG